MWLAVWPGVVMASSVQPSPLHRFAVGQRAVGPEVGVVGGFHPRPVADMERPRRPVRAFGQNQRAGRGLDRRHAGRMIAVGVGDENMRDGLAAHRIEQRRAVGGVLGTGIDDRDFAAADDVAHRALEGERARIVAQKPPHAGHRLVDAAGDELEILVVWDVFSHGPV